MRAKLMTALVVILFTACEREADDSLNQITVLVTVEYQNGKIMQFFYHGKLIWQSEPASSTYYWQTNNLIYLDYTTLNGQKKEAVFKGGELIKKQ